MHVCLMRMHLSQRMNRTQVGMLTGLLKLAVQTTFKIEVLGNTPLLRSGCGFPALTVGPHGIGQVTAHQVSNIPNESILDSNIQTISWFPMFSSAESILVHNVFSVNINGKMNINGNAEERFP